MAFTTGGHLLSSHTSLQPRDNEINYMRDRIDDLETAVLCHIHLIKDITTSKTHPQDIEAVLHFPVHCYKQLLDQQLQIRHLLSRFDSQLLSLRSQVTESEQKTESSKVQEILSIRESAIKLSETKKYLSEKEGIVQQMEHERCRFEGEKELVISANVSTLTRNVSISMVKGLIVEVNKAGKVGEREKDVGVERCLRLDNALKVDRKAFKRPNRRPELAKIIETHFGLDLTYENYWYQQLPGEYEVPESISSADSFQDGISEAEIRNLVRIETKTQKNEGNEAEIKHYSGEIQKLMIRIDIQNAEMRSFQRLLGQLSHFNDYINAQIERKQRKMSAEVKGFEEEVAWEATP